MLKKVLIVVVVVIVGFLGFVATRPATYRVERSTSIAASPAVVFPFINSHKNFILWSPWQKLDPNVQTTFTGPEEGVGATYAWTGNDKMGKGKMSIVESKPNELVKSDLEFIEPFESKSAVSFTITPEGEGSKVTWAMDGNNDLFGKAFGVVMDMDKMLGTQFDEGLAGLKTLAEEKAKAAPPPAPPAPPAPVGDAPAAADAGPAPAP